MSAKPDFVVNNPSRSAGAATGAFVINLTSSTTPMALSQPKDPTLAQFTFFVSRRLEDGRERFRLHMGYFETLQAAEDMLSVVREVYPQAWAGDAPGKKLPPGVAPATARAPAAARARAAAPPPPAAPARPAMPPPVAKSSPPPAAPRAAPPVAAKPVQKPAVQKVNTPPQAPAFEVPFLLSDDAPSSQPVNVPVVRPPAKPVVSPPPRAAAPAQPARPPQKTVQKPPAPARAVAPKLAVTKPAAPPAATRAAPTKPPAVAPKIAAQVTAPALQAAAPRPAAPAAKIPASMAPKAPPPKAPEPKVQMPAISQQAAALSNVRQVIEELDDLSDTQTIRMLERHSPFREGSREADVDEAIQVIKPEDTQSMLAIKAEVKRNAPVLFAVQLDWSATSFDMGKIPPLAIFNAYTLYTTEAIREGRAWYGLRLGFFSDAVSAKQVAYYVRSDFKTVSVVPVTTIEKERATDLNASRSGIYQAANIKEGPAPTAESIAAADRSGAFQLLEDDTPDHIEQDVDGEASPRFSKPAPSAAPALVAESEKKAEAKRKPATKAPRREANAPTEEETLDQTLEILGANALEITNDSAENTGVRHLRVKIDKKGSKFASLIDRLSGKK